MSDQQNRSSSQQQQLNLKDLLIEKPSSTFNFKKLFIAYTFGFLPFLLIEAVFVGFNKMPIIFNEHEFTGWKGVIICLIYIPVVGLMMACVNWAFLNMGQWFHGLFLKLFKKDSALDKY